MLGCGKLFSKINVSFAFALLSGLMACGQTESESSNVSTSRGACHSKKAICESDALSLYPTNPMDANYSKQLRAYIAKSQECARYVCENADFKF